MTLGAPRVAAALLLFIALGPGLPACRDEIAGVAELDGSCGAFCACQPASGSTLVAQFAARAIDVLFIIDNSGSMEEEQRNLAANLGHCILHKPKVRRHAFSTLLGNAFPVPLKFNEYDTWHDERDRTKLYHFLNDRKYWCLLRILRKV